MEIVGSVDPEEVPQDQTTRAFGVWTGLAVQAVAAAAKGKVLVVMLQDRDEFKRMRNGIADRLRYLGYSRSLVTEDQPDGRIKVWLQLVPRADTATVVVQPMRRPRRRANG